MVVGSQDGQQLEAHARAVNGEEVACVVSFKCEVVQQTSSLVVRGIEVQRLTTACAVPGVQCAKTKDVSFCSRTHRYQQATINEPVKMMPLMLENKERSVGSSAS